MEREHNRRIYSTGPLRRVGSGQQSFDKESLEGPLADPMGERRKQLQRDASLTPPRKSFASALERLGTPNKK
jgi:hypothetical protein